MLAAVGLFAGESQATYDHPPYERIQLDVYREKNRPLPPHTLIPPPPPPSAAE